MDIDLVREDSHDKARLVLVDGTFYPEIARHPDAVLHPREAAYFFALEADKRKRDFLLGRYAAKRALTALAPGIEPPEIEIRPGVFQQPVVLHPRAAGLAVCLTHTGPLAAAVAFPAGHPLGVDTEVVDPAYLGALAGQIAPEDLPATGCGSVEGHFRAWTVKEALSKVLRCGLTAPFPLLAVAQTIMAEGAFTGRFRNFPQYAFLSLAAGRCAFALVHPARTALGVDRAAVLAFLRQTDGPETACVRS